MDKLPTAGELAGERAENLVRVNRMERLVDRMDELANMLDDLDVQCEKMKDSIAEAKQGLDKSSDMLDLASMQLVRQAGYKLAEYATQWIALKQEEEMK